MLCASLNSRGTLVQADYALNKVDRYYSEGKLCDIGKRLSLEKTKGRSDERGGLDKKKN